MNAQSNVAMHTRAVAQAAKIKQLESDLFAAGERSGEARGFRRGLGCAALLAVCGFVSGLVLSVYFAPLIAWWLK